jgi:hypothetical protein
MSSFLSSALDGIGWLAPPSALVGSDRILGITCTVGRMGHWAGLDGANSLAPTEIRSPDRRSRSDSE